MIRRLSASEVKALIDAGEPVRLLDVRTEAEWRISRLSGAVLATRETVPEILESWPRDETVVVHCHHGVRSLVACQGLAREGFTDLVNLEGGIEAWSREVDPDVPRYRVLPDGDVVAA